MSNIRFLPVRDFVSLSWYIFTLFRSEQPHFQALTPATSNIILLTSVQSSGRPLWPSLSFIWQVWHIKRMTDLKRVIREPLLGHSKFETRDFLLFSSSIFLRPPKIACLVSCVSLILPPSPVHKRPHFVSLSSDASILDAIRYHQLQHLPKLNLVLDEMQWYLVPNKRCKLQVGSIYLSSVS